jgi:hypothetical protein
MPRLTIPAGIDTLLFVPEKLAINLHGLCRALISGPETLLAPVAFEFAHHRIAPDKLGPPDLIAELSLGFSGPPTAGFRLGAWQVELSGLEKPPLRLVFRGNRLSRFIVSKWIIEPALRYLLTRQGFPPVHSTCLTDGDSGVVVAAGATAGKTTLLLEWLSQGYPFLSDDYTILAPGRALAYVTPLRLGARNFIETRKLRELPLRDRLALLGRTAVRHLLLNKVRFAYKAPVDRIFPGVKLLSEVPLAMVVILEGEDRVGFREIPADAAADLIAAVDHHELHGFDRILEAAGDSGHPTRYRREVGKILQTVPCLEAGWSIGPQPILDQLMREK